MNTNNIITNYQQILEFANQLKIPIEKPRAIIREYLQSLVISVIFLQPKSNKLCFVGGTSLRLLRDIDRFSEDLDFDNLGLKNEEIDFLIKIVIDRLNYQNIDVELITKHNNNKNYYELRFPNLLFDLKISTNPREKLMIKIDYANLWKDHKPETKLFSKYGFIERIITNPQDHLLVQKIASYIQRKQTQPRDIYDIVWLYSQGAKFDSVFAKANNLEFVLEESLPKYNKEGISSNLKKRLQPFLFIEDNIRKLDFFPEVIEKLLQSKNK